MRGKLNHGGTVGQRNRNIPAYAGKTLVIFFMGAACEEHPRVCGENRVWWEGALGQKGTSPRMRGKQKSSSAAHEQERNIPAYAGKTTYDGLIGFNEAEHPRVCGENGIGFT